MKTTYFARNEDFTPDKRKWHLIDADGQTLGRLAVRIANILRGKNKPVFTPHVDTGDCVVVINAEKVKMTGRKADQKIYYHHTGYIGHLKSATARQLLDKHPERVLESAVSGMLPKNRMRKEFMKKLRVYAGTEHPHAAQKPEKMELN